MQILRLRLSICVNSKSVRLSHSFIQSKRVNTRRDVILYGVGGFVIIPTL